MEKITEQTTDPVTLQDSEQVMYGFNGYLSSEKSSDFDIKKFHSRDRIMQPRFSLFKKMSKTMDALRSNSKIMQLRESINLKY